MCQAAKKKKTRMPRLVAEAFGAGGEAGAGGTGNNG